MRFAGMTWEGVVMVTFLCSVIGCVGGMMYAHTRNEKSDQFECVQEVYDTDYGKDVQCWKTKKAAKQ